MYIELHSSLTTDGRASANMFGVKRCPLYWIYRRQMAAADWLAVSTWHEEGGHL